MNTTEYRTKREQILKAIDQLRLMRDQSILKDAELKSQLSSISRNSMISNLDRESTRLRNPDLTVAFVGGFSAGKSSLINAFLGRYLLPESTKVTTAVPTYVRSCDDSAEEAELHYLKEDELSSLDDLFRKEIAEAFGIPELEGMPLQQLMAQTELLAIGGRGKNLIEYLKIFHEEREKRSSQKVGEIDKVSLERAAEVIRDEKEAMFLDRVVLKIKNKEIPQDVVLVDLPGISVPNPRHRQITYRFIRNDANAVVFVLMATQLFTKDVLEIAEIFRSGDKEVAEKTFWVMNRWDALSELQRQQTLEDFTNKMKELNIKNARQFRTNALYGLLSQLAMTDELKSNPDLKHHEKDYSDKVAREFGDDHQKVFTESDLPRLQQDIFEFLDSEIRETTLRTAKTVAKRDFCQPVLSCLNENRKRNETQKDEALQKQEEKEVNDRLKNDCERQKQDIRSRLENLRKNIVGKRGDLLPANELPQKLTEAITGGKETDAYEIYLEILAEKKLRKFPYYFEIESQIVDKLNSMVKEHFLSDMQGVSEKLLEQCREEIKEFIEFVEKDVAHLPEVAAGIRQCLIEKEQEFFSGVEHTVKTYAAKLDGLLVYKMQKGFFFSRQGEIFDGLEKAAKHGYAKIGDLNATLSQDDFTEKTTIIRDVLKKHYIESVQQAHKEIGNNISPPFINILQDVQQLIIMQLDGAYKTQREKVLKQIVSEIYDKKRNVNEERTKLYRTWIEQIEKYQAELDFTKSIET